MTTPTTSGSASTVTLTGDHNIDSLIFGQRWASATITYSLPSYNASWSNDPDIGYGLSTGDKEPWHNFSPLDATEAAQFKVALQQWSNVANIQFVQSLDNTSTVGDIRIAFSKATVLNGAQAVAYLPDGTPIGGDIWFNADSSSFGSTFAKGSYSFLTLLHELGHAIGLKHPFEAETTNPAVIDTQFDSKLYTVMSYSADPAQQATSLSFYPTTPMVYDLLAIQAMYGKNLSYNTGDTVYSFADNDIYLETIWDAGGTNTIQYTGTHNASIDLREGHGSTLGNEVNVENNSGSVIHPVANVWIAYDTDIQNAIGGSGYNTIVGNDLPNHLVGGSAGNRMTGGVGNDTITGSAGVDVAVYLGHRSSFTLTTTADGYTITDTTGTEGVDTLSNIERLSFSDAEVAIDTSGTAGKVYRLYQAAFDRAPLPTGLGFWMHSLESGVTMQQVAGDFIASAEFKALYGTNPSTETFITNMYLHTLHRAPKAEGLSWWVNSFNDPATTKENTLIGFSESAENQAQVIGSIQNGMEYIPYG